MDSGGALGSDSGADTNSRMKDETLDKLDKFDGCSYTHWADKMKFSLILLKVDHVLDPKLPPIPIDPVLENGEPADDKVIADLQNQRMLRIEDEALCCKYIKSTLSERLYHLHGHITDPRLLWNVLEYEYKPWEHLTGRHLIMDYLKFEIIDDKSVLEQVHELQVFVDKLKALSISLPDAFQTSVIINKLPPSWRKFYLTMLYKKEEYSLDDLLEHIRAEEAAKGQRGSKVRDRSPKSTKLGVTLKTFKRAAPQKCTTKHARKNKYKDVVNAEIVNMVSHIHLDDVANG